MLPTYQIGIIGYGKIGIRHHQKIIANPHCKVVAIADNKQERLTLIKDASIQVFQNYQEILTIPTLDIVAICTPNHLHSEMTIKALAQKKHVICEKPMALSKANCIQMIEASLNAEKKLFIVKQNRYNPPIQAIQQLINTHKLGKLFSIVVNCYWNRNDQYYLDSDWKGVKTKDGGALYTQFSHFVDLLQWFGGEATQVFAQTHNHHHPNLDIDDTGNVIINFKKGLIGSLNYTNCSYQKNMEGSITIFAEKGTVKIGGQYLNELEYQLIENHTIANIASTQGPNDYGYYQGSMSNHHKVYENVVNSLNGKESIAVNAVDGMKTVAIIEAAYQSSELNQPILL